MIGDFLKRVVHGDRLSQTDAGQCCELLLCDQANPIEVAGLLCALHARGETVAELTGFLDTLRRHMTKVPLGDPRAVDLCGTGGDGSHSFNVSTAAALLAAACGAVVPKHGNRAVSSRCGSADVLEQLGIPLSLNPPDAERCLRACGFAFLFAPHFHPAMKHVAPVRKALGVRTLFNLLGPLANPAGVKRQLIGVYHARWLRPLAETLAQAGSEFVITVHGDGGLDEVTPLGTTRYCQYYNGEITEGVWQASEWGLGPTSHHAVRGGDATANAARLRSAAQGNEPELSEWIIANCAPALVLSQRAADFREGALMARASIHDGTFLRFLDKAAAA